MVANCSEFDQIIKSLTKNIISEGITLFNHNDVIQILQIIIENKNNELESKYVPLLIFSIYNCQDNLPLIKLLIKEIKCNILYNFTFNDDYLKNDCCNNTDKNNLSKELNFDNGNNHPPTYREAKILEDGSKEITTYQVDPTTQERIILDVESIKKPNENEIENIFSGFLNPKNNTETEMTENDL